MTRCFPGQSQKSADRANRHHQAHRLPPYRHRHHRHGYELSALYLEETYGLTSEKKIAAAIGIVANENGYHPIRDYLNGLTWDGTERIRTCLHHFLGADSDQYTYEALRLFLLGAIHRAFHPGCKFEVMLCLVGGQEPENPPFPAAGRERRVVFR